MNKISNLPKGFISLYVSTFRSAYLDSHDEKLASDMAWNNIKSKYKRIGQYWIQKEEKSLFEMYITKSSLDDSGKMTFAMSASDVIPDSFDERMSIQLYKSFIERLDGHEFVSLAHYPRLENNLGVLGDITNLYIDGTILKAKGYFLNTPLGIASYNTIRKERRDNVPFAQRTRVSIGFYDYAHTHGNLIWRYSNETPFCEECAIKNTKGKIYLDGKIDHCALTKYPALKSTSIDLF